MPKWNSLLSAFASQLPAGQWNRDRLSWMRFLNFELGGATPDKNTIRHFRNRMTETGTLKRVMKAFDWQLHKKGYIPMSGQIVDATLVPVPRQRNTDVEKEAVKVGKSAKEIWLDHPNKAAQKDTSALWTLKAGEKVCCRPDGTPSTQTELLSNLVFEDFQAAAFCWFDGEMPLTKSTPLMTSAR